VQKLDFAIRNSASDTLQIENSEYLKCLINKGVMNFEKKTIQKSCIDTKNALQKCPDSQEMGFQGAT